MDAQRQARWLRKREIGIAVGLAMSTTFSVMAL